MKSTQENRSKSSEKQSPITEQKLVSNFVAIREGSNDDKK